MAELTNYLLDLRAVFSGCVILLLFAGAGYAYFSRPRSWTSRFLALAFVFAAFADAHIMLGILWDTGLGGAPWVVTSYVGAQLAQTAALVGFFTVFPRPVRWRSWHGVVMGATIACTAVVILLWTFDRRAFFVDWPSASRPTLLYALYGRDAYAAVAIVPAFISAVLRARPTPGEGAGSQAILAGAMAPQLWIVGWLVVRFVAFALGYHWIAGEWQVAASAAPVAGDCCRLGFYTSELRWIVLLALAVFVAAIWRAPALLAVILGYGALGTLVLRTSPIDWWSAHLAWGPILLLYAAQRHALASFPAPPRWFGRIFMGMAFATAFIFTVTFVTSLGQDPFTIQLGTLSGLGLGALVAWTVRPRELRDPIDDRDEGARRVQAYRAALESRMSTGLVGRPLSDDLKSLRTQLGITDRDHAVAEQMLLRSDAGALSAGLSPGRTFLNRYVATRLLGRGGQSETWLCRDQAVRRDVVIKTLRAEYASPDGLDGVLREARALAQIHHPNVVVLFDVEAVGDEAVLVLEYVDGGSLAERIARGPLLPQETERIALDLLGAIAAVHEAGIVHRDVKPANVLLKRSGHAKLADFGVAHLPGFETTIGGVGGRDGAVGTIRFMSPEQARGREPTRATDLFGAGATIYEAMTGEPYLAPRPGETAAELHLRAAQAGPFPDTWSGPAPMRAWFARMLAPHPDDRFASAHDARDAFEAARRASLSIVAEHEKAAPDAHHVS